MAKLQHTNQEGCPACQAAEDLAMQIRTLIMRAGCEDGPLSVPDVIDCMIRLMGETIFNSVKEEHKSLGASGLAQATTEITGAIITYVGTLAMKKDQGGLDMMDARTQQRIDESAPFSELGIADRRSAPVLSPADPSNLHRRHNDIALNDRIQAMLRKPYRGKVH